VKDYDWNENLKTININVPLKGVNQSKADVFCGEEFLKVHFPPYLFEAILYKPINDTKSSTVIRDNLVSINLIKAEEELWGRLLSTKSDDKKYVLAKKIEAIEKAQKKSEVEINERKTNKDLTKKYTVQEMMKLEQGDRSRIEKIKNEERQKVQKELSTWKEIKKRENEKQILENEKSYGVKIENIKTIVEEDHPKIIELEDESFEETDTKMIFNNICNQSRISVKTFDNDLNVKQIKNNGGVRKNQGSITVSFTPRHFPTPVRESKLSEENEWLEKQYEARKSFKIEDPDLKEHEQDADWLANKASQLFTSGDIQGAVNAYTLAIRIRPKMPLYFSNRSACHLKLRNLYKCMEDASKALDLLNPPVEQNAKLRLKSHIRRASAFCNLELYVEALQDYEAALKIDPKNENLVEDAKKLRKIIQSEN